MRPKGFNHTEKTKRKISKAHMGIITQNKGLTKETNNKIKMQSEMLTGRRRPEITGNKNPNWKGGIASAMNKRVSSLRWKQLAAKIRKRDKFICLYCKKSKRQMSIICFPLDWVELMMKLIQ